jgi:hypothetical protein
MYALSRERVCHQENDTGNLVTEPLSSNGRLLWFQFSGFQAARHIAPSLALFVPNSLTVYYLFFSPEGSARDIFVWLGIFSFHGANHYHRSLLMCARPQRHPYMVQSIPSMLLSSLFFFLSVSLGAGASTLPAPALPAVSFSVLEGADPSTMSNTLSSASQQQI